MTTRGAGRHLVHDGMTEASFQAVVIDLARMTGHRVRFTPPTRGYGRAYITEGEPGWPDLTIWSRRRFLLAELKSQRGRLSPTQRAVIDDLRSAGVDVRVWRPSDWDDITATLTRSP